jgi:hypothetical protein
MKGGGVTDETMVFPCCDEGINGRSIEDKL